MLENLGRNKLVFLVTASCSLVAGIAGVLQPGMYGPVVSDTIVPGVFAQDLVVIAASLLMMVLSVGLTAHAYRALIVVIGLMGFFFYAYGIYAIEQIYTPFYLLYLAVVALSFYGLAYALTSLQAAAWEELSVSPALRIGAAGYGILVAVVFNVLWISQLVPLLRVGNRIEYTFSVYIIDLVFIMPAFVVAAVLALQRRALGLVGLPALFIVGVGILAPLALAEGVKPSRYGQPMDPGGVWFYGGLASVFLVLAVAWVVGLRPQSQRLTQS